MSYEIFHPPPPLFPACQARRRAGRQKEEDFRDPSVTWDPRSVGEGGDGGGGTRKPDSSAHVRDSFLLGLVQAKMQSAVGRRPCRKESGRSFISLYLSLSVIGTSCVYLSPCPPSCADSRRGCRRGGTWKEHNMIIGTVERPSYYSPPVSRLGYAHSEREQSGRSRLAGRGEGEKGRGIYAMLSATFLLVLQPQGSHILHAR